MEGGTTSYPLDDSTKVILNADVRYDPAEERVRLIAGGAPGLRTTAGIFTIE